MVKSHLTLCMLGKNFSRGPFEIFLLFPRKEDLIFHKVSDPIFLEK